MEAHIKIKLGGTPASLTKEQVDELIASVPSLYEKTGDIKDINTLMVPRDTMVTMLKSLDANRTALRRLLDVSSDKGVDPFSLAQAVKALSNT